MKIVMPEMSSRLKELRKEKQLKQREMAALLECTERHYQKIEYGEINLPSLDVIFLANYFGVSTDYLLGLSDHRARLEPPPSHPNQNKRCDI